MTKPTRGIEARLDMAYANGVQACLQRLYAAGARQDKHDRAWEDCEAMWRNRVAAVYGKAGLRSKTDNT